MVANTHTMWERRPHLGPSATSMPLSPQPTHCRACAAVSLQGLELGRAAVHPGGMQQRHAPVINGSAGGRGRHRLTLFLNTDHPCSCSKLSCRIVKGRLSRVHQLRLTGCGCTISSKHSTTQSPRLSLAGWLAALAGCLAGCWLSGCLAVRLAVGWKTSEPT